MNPSAVAPGWPWSLDPIQLAPLALVALLYARRVATLARRGRPVPARRQAWFYAGVAVVALALVSPVDAVGEERLFWVHMVQHLMLGDVGALLIVLGLSGPLLRPLLAFGPLRALRALAHPLVALPLWIACFYAWHLPALYQAALRHDGIHALEHLLFFATGALMWAAVVEPLPGPAWFGSGPKAAYTLVIRTAGAILANVFIWSSHAFYPVYAAGERISGISPVTDQRIGGLIMFTEGGIVTLVAFGVLFLRWTREAELRQSLLDEGYDSVAAARAARYGRSALAQR
ncbi:MAG TPA: cytochrome c oxidase assembly protein [Thermoleophilaceae bacterium]